MIDKFKNYIFDFDGTIANSNKFHNIAFKKTLKTHKKILNKFKYENVKGLATGDAFKKIGIINEINKLTKLKRLYFKSQIHKIDLYKNSKETLNLLKKKKKKIFIVSGASKKNIKFVLKKNKIKVNGIISSENTQFSKPHIMPYKMCIIKYKLNKKYSVVIEDAISGIVSAKKNKLITIGINNKKIKSKSDFFFSNFSIFLKKLKKS